MQHDIKEMPYQSEEDLRKYLDRDFSGILMADRVALDMIGRNHGFIINRGLNHRVFNPYESPYVGFRGAMNLCALWIEEMLS